MTANYQAAGDLLHSWRDDVLSGTPPVLYPVGTGELERFEIGPKRVLLLGGRRDLAKRDSRCKSSSMRCD